MKTIITTITLSTALLLPDHAYAHSFHLQANRLYAFRNAPHQISLLWGDTQVFHRSYTRCAMPRPRIVRAWNDHHGTDYVQIRWCSRYHTRGWQL